MKAVAAQRMKKIKNAQITLAKDIDMDVLVKGTGSEAHERELYKLLAATGIKTEDLGNPQILSMIQEILTEYIVDEEMNQEEVGFLA